ncbi:MAG: cob(I)yrinic acid a,c-diamide adenosyltransferase [Cyanobacteriota bacterium]
MLKNGYVQIYTGDGKGKTTASLGLALRAIGHGWKVLIIQFTKGEKEENGENFYGELKAASKFMANLEVMQFGLDRVVYSSNISIEDYKETRKGWERAKEAVASGEYGLIILDEINVCIDLNMIKLSEVKELLINRPKHLEVVLTGRRAHPELISMAHLVTEMKPIKHYFDVGVKARRGIEY